MPITVETDGTYDARCEECDWVILGIETLETAGHLIDMHRGDEHFDD